MDEIKSKLDNNKQDEKIWCVYIHTNKINGKKYVGITSQKPEDRWRKNGKGYKHCILFWRAIQKYGWENFKHEVIFQNETFEYACKIEKCLIKHYKTTNHKYGYNLTSGGEGVLGIKPWNYGVPMSEEQKEKLRQASIGRVCTKETRRKLSAAKKGKPPNNAGRPMSQSTKNKLSDALKGHMTSDQTKQKISIAKRGKCTGVNSSRYRPIYCIELNEIFWGAKEANIKYGFATCNIGACCRGERNYAHVHPETGEKLHWLYAEDAISKGYITADCLNNYLHNLTLA